MRKQITDFSIVENKRLDSRNVLLILTPVSGSLPETQPGQFAEIKVEHSPATLLRRPISIHYADPHRHMLWLLIQEIGAGTCTLGSLKPGETVNLILPLGNSFTCPESADEKVLLIGGGVGVAPLFYLGHRLREKGYEPEFLLGARTADAILQLDLFRTLGKVHIATEDGSLGEKGLVTAHSALRTPEYNRFYTCGPKPMMKAVAALARQAGIICEVSLENTMACGFGACLCCVEETTKGNRCVCKEGPVFNINQLKWQI